MLAALLMALAAPAAAQAVPGDLSYQGCITGDTGSGPTGSNACAQIAAATAGGQFSGLDRLESIAVSPDGTSVYVAAGSVDDAVARFNRDPATGALTYAGCFSGDTGNTGCVSIAGATAAGNNSGLNHPESVAVSPDGRSVYLTSRFDDAIAQFARDPATGALTYQGCDSSEDESVPSPCDPIGPTTAGGTNSGFDDPKLKAAVIAPDGRFVYAVGAEDDSVVIFDRDPTSGVLSFDSCLTGEQTASPPCVDLATSTADGSNSGLNDPRWLELSADGAHLYAVASNDSAFAHFTRDSASGALTFAGCVTGNTNVAVCDQAPEASPGVNGSGFANPRAFVLSANGEFAYGTGSNDSAVLRFDRDPASGSLAFLDCTTAAEGSGPAGTGACSQLPNSSLTGDNTGFSGMRSMAISADGVSLYISAQFDSALSNFDVDPSSGTISLDSCVTGDTDVACAPIPSAAPAGIASGLHGLETIALSPDDRSLYGAAEDNDAVSRFDREPVPAPPPPDEAFCKSRTATKIDGTAGDDRLAGTEAIDLISGLGGDDRLDGAGDNDCVSGDDGADVARGGAGNDLMTGGAGKDKVRGQGSQDKIEGGRGTDRLNGGGGRDKLRGGAAKDRFKAGGGRDKINSVDGERERVDCGGGKDKATVDERDRVKRNCERVTESG